MNQSYKYSASTLDISLDGFILSEADISNRVVRDGCLNPRSSKLIYVLSNPQSNASFS